MAVIAALVVSRPAPDPHLPQYRLTEPLKWYTDVLRLLVSSCSYHRVIAHEDGKDIDPTKAVSHPHVDSSIIQQLRKVLPKDTMAMFRSSAEPTSATFILSTIKQIGSLLLEEDELDDLLKAFLH